MGIQVLTIALAGFFGFLSGVGIFGALYFINGGDLLTESAVTLLLAPPVAFGFAFGYLTSKPLPEAYAFSGMLLVAEVLFLTAKFPLSTAILLVGMVAIAGWLMGFLARIFSIHIPGTSSRKSTA